MLSCYLQPANTCSMARLPIPSFPVRLREGSFLARIAAWKMGTSSVAMVLGRTIHLWGVTRAEFLADTAWVRHELMHVEQYRRYGVIGFLLRYVWESIRRGYRNNYLEVEARAVEEGETVGEMITNYGLRFTNS